MQDTIINKIVRMRMPKGERRFSMFTDSDVSLKNKAYNSRVQNPDLSKLVVSKMLRGAERQSETGRNETALWKTQIDGRMMSCANGNEVCD